MGINGQLQPALIPSRNHCQLTNPTIRPLAINRGPTGSLILHGVWLGHSVKGSVLWSLVTLALDPYPDGRSDAAMVAGLFHVLADFRPGNSGQ